MSKGKALYLGKKTMKLCDCTICGKMVYIQPQNTRMGVCSGLNCQARYYTLATLAKGKPVLIDNVWKFGSFCPPDPRPNDEKRKGPSFFRSKFWWGITHKPSVYYE